MPHVQVTLILLRKKHLPETIAKAMRLGALIFTQFQLANISLQLVRLMLIKKQKMILTKMDKTLPINMQVVELMDFITFRKGKVLSKIIVPVILLQDRIIIQFQLVNIIQQSAKLMPIKRLIMTLIRMGKILLIKMQNVLLENVKLILMELMM